MESSGLVSRGGFGSNGFRLLCVADSQSCLCFGAHHHFKSGGLARWQSGGDQHHMPLQVASNPSSLLSLSSGLLLVP